MGNYLSLVKFSHTVFAMPFALTGYFTAVYAHGYGFNPLILLLIVLCMVFARNAAMGFNRYLDRDIDKLNPRTSKREIPNKIITPKNAILFVIINSILFITTTAFINMLCLVLSPIALAVILGYSFTKRYTWLCHLVLGLGLSLAPIGAYLAVSAQFHYVAIIYSLIVLFWVAGFDIIYALNDEKFDRQNNLFSIPSYFGEKKARIISAFFHLISGCLLLIIAYFEMFELIATVGVLVFLSLLIIQHIIVIISRNRINAAFFITNGIASIILAIGIILEMIIIYY
ncbi:MAG: putative 4-hydroxybenzoate polyprenyltransferase [Bacteroidetes bacterium]|nr:putative 4-hydroxybenzoate polyprenyltransferase [Bacteroidota bacterium]